MKGSTKSGQSQLLIPLLVVLTSALVFATNTYINATNSSMSTGNFLMQQTFEKDFSIDVWANTSTVLDANSSTARATLSMDNGTAVAGQEIRFYLNDSLATFGETNDQGYVEVALDLSNESYVVKAVFEGSTTLFLNPSQTAIEIQNTEPTQNETNATEDIKPTFHLTSDNSVSIGDLEITVFNVSEDSYKTLDLDENYERIEKKYYKFYIKVFNNFSKIPRIYDLNDNEVIKILLEDSLGNFYGQEEEISFFLGSSDLFGNSMEILPSSSREGYLIFPETKGAPENLTVQIKSGAKAEFRIE